MAENKASEDEKRMQPQYMVIKNLYSELSSLIDKYPERVNYVEKEGNGDTALHVACFKRNTSMIELLLQKGANVELTNNNGDSPLFVAVFFGFAEITQLLISHGSKLNMKKSKMQGGYTALHVACWKGHLDVALQLISSGANLEATNEHQYTSLHVASHYGHKEIVQALISSGASLCAQNYSGDTPLHIACIDGCLEIAVLLIKNGADLYSHNILKETPLDVYVDKLISANLIASKEANVLILTETYTKEMKWRRRKHFAYFLSLRSKTVMKQDALLIQPTHLKDRVFLQLYLVRLIASFL